MGPSRSNVMAEDRFEPVPDFHDPRMRGFRARTLVTDVELLIARRVGALQSEEISFSDGAGRVLAQAVVASAPVPAFDRAAMDGYALRGEETIGVSSYSPASFRCIGAARPGRHRAVAVGPGEAIEIATGSALPEGADTVVKVESTRRLGDQIAIFEATPPGRNVSRRGEDVVEGTVVLGAGRVLRPQDLGVLSALAVPSIAVIRQPRVELIVTGDELLPPGTPAEGSRLADMNSVMLTPLIARDGGVA